ncbi:MAG: RNA methyltransferase [Rhodobiaceae bacterium]|nr:RNA methyltransferase [Rhodobiaceae bacterium]MCC0042102.1 RNA methyltransferase [Rhodobiaceae bacterium]
MAGTDTTRPNITGGPAIVLVRPQLGENIGTAARAMANFGLSELRIVDPRDGWPSEGARKAASGANWVIDGARVFASTQEAIADLSLVLATTARQRDMRKQVLGPQAAADVLHAREGAGAHCGILFGGERAGLDNEDISLADAILTYPVNPAFASLNLAQAVLIMAYEWQRAAGTAGTRETFAELPDLAPKAELLGFFEHLETELDRGGFLKPPEKAPVMVRNLRNIFHRAALTSQDLRSLRGVIVALTGRAFRRNGAP